MTADRVAMIERIQKLLDHHQGATEAEASTAVALAMKLLDKHRISMVEVESHQADDGWKLGVAADHGSTENDEAPWVAPLLTTFFGVRTMRIVNGSPPTIKTAVFGDETNVEIAVWLFSYLQATYRDLWLEHRTRTGCHEARKRAFYNGLTDGLCQKLQQERERERRARKGSTELAISELRIDEALQKKMPPMPVTPNPTPSPDLETVFAGVAAGRKINLNRTLADETAEAAK